jgi:hypothetical protein
LNSRLIVIVILRRSNRFRFRCGRTLPNQPDDREGHAPRERHVLAPRSFGLAAHSAELPWADSRCDRPRSGAATIVPPPPSLRATPTSIRAAAGQKSIVDNYTHVSHYVVMIVTKCGVWRGCGGGGASIALDARNLVSRRQSLLRGPRRSASRARNDRPHRRSRAALLPMVGFNNPGHTLIRRPSDVMPATPGPPDTHGRLT